MRCLLTVTLPVLVFSSGEKWRGSSGFTLLSGFPSAFVASFGGFSASAGLPHPTTRSERAIWESTREALRIMGPTVLQLGPRAHRANQVFLRQRKEGEHG